MREKAPNSRPAAPGRRRARASGKHSVPLRRRPFGVFSKPEGIVHCGLILVTLLGKASPWAGPEGSFQVLSARLELCHPLALLPVPLAVRKRGPGPGPGADLLSFTPGLSGTR